MFASPKYLVLMTQDDLPDLIRQCHTWAEAMDLREQGGIVYEQAPRGTPTCDLLRASIDKVKLEAAIADVKGGA